MAVGGAEVDVCEGWCWRLVDHVIGEMLLAMLASFFALASQSVRKPVSVRVESTR